MSKAGKTIQVSIFMAGDLAEARRVIRSYCYNVGFCVTVTPTDFIYTGGEESGFVVGIVNYPRFPVGYESQLVQHAHDLVDLLLPALNQKSALIVAPSETTWVTRTPPGAP